MALLDYPRRLLSNLSARRGARTRAEADREPDRRVWIEPVDEEDDDFEDPVAEADEDAEDEADAEDEDDYEDEDDEEVDEDFDEDGDEDPSDESDEDDSDGDGKTDISDITAPSIGPNTKIEKEDPEERLARHEQSDKDAMGLDKRREVIGGSYSPSVARQLTTYGVVIAVIGAIAVGLVLLANKMDQPPDKYDDAAPWSQADAQQIPPTEIDFPNSGHPGPGEDPQPTPGETSGSASSQNVAESQD